MSFELAQVRPRDGDLGAPDVDVELKAVAQQVGAVLVTVREAADASLDITSRFELRNHCVITQIPEVDFPIQGA
jgi:hypothetical protein